MGQWLPHPTANCVLYPTVLHTPSVYLPHPLLSFCAFSACSSRSLSLPLSAILSFSGFHHPPCSTPHSCALPFCSRLSLVPHTLHLPSLRPPASAPSPFLNLPAVLPNSGLSQSFLPTPPLCSRHKVQQDTNKTMAASSSAIKQASKLRGFCLVCFLRGLRLGKGGSRREEERVPWYLWWGTDLVGARRWTDVCRGTLRTAELILGSVCGQHTY